MQKVRTIVAGVDFTEPSLNALREAVRLAGSGESEGAVYAVHVLEEQAVADLRRTTEQPPDLEEHARADAHRRISEFIGSVKDQVAVEIVLGRPAEMLLRRAGELGADLLVMARNSTSDPGRGAGSHAVKCVRHAAMDVLLVRREHRGSYGRVAACVDFSGNAEAAAATAAAIAERDDAELHLLHAFHPPWDVVPFAATPMAASTAIQGDYVAMLEDHVQRLAEELHKRHPKLRIRRHVEPAGSVGSTLVTLLEQINADLAVLGSHGRGRIERMLLGSTAERVIRSAHCSVLTVKHAASDQPPQQ